MAKSKQIDLAVLETAEWYKGDRVMTVRPLFQQLMQSVTGNANRFHYATFTGPDSFEETLKDLVHTHGVQYIYISTHGEEGKMQFSFNRQRKATYLSKFDCLAEKSLSGVFFAGCELGSLAQSVSARLQGKVKGQAPWFAGYDTSVGWIDAAFLDLAFLRLVLLHEEYEDLKVIKSQNDIRQALDVFDEGVEGIFPPFGEVRWDLGLSFYVNGKKIDIYEEDETE